MLIISPVSEGSGDVMVLRRSRPPPAARNGVNVITQKPRDGLFSNLVYTLVVIVSWPEKLFKVVGQRSRSQRQKMMWFFRHFWIFISYHIFLLNQVEGTIAIPPSNSAPLPLFCPSVCPSVCPSIGLLTTFSGFCTFADKSLGRNGIELGLEQRRAVVIIGRLLLPSLVDTGDICCHYWQHILVWLGNKYLFGFHIIRWHWYVTSCQDFHSRKMRSSPFHFVNYMTADGLVILGARASAAIVLHSLN